MISDFFLFQAIIVLSLAVCYGGPLLHPPAANFHYSHSYPTSQVSYSVLQRPAAAHYGYHGSGFYPGAIGLPSYHHGYTYPLVRTGFPTLGVHSHAPGHVLTPSVPQFPSVLTPISPKTDVFGFTTFFTNVGNKTETETGTKKGEGDEMEKEEKEGKEEAKEEKGEEDVKETKKDEKKEGTLPFIPTLPHFPGLPNGVSTIVVHSYDGHQFFTRIPQKEDDKKEKGAEEETKETKKDEKKEVTLPVVPGLPAGVSSVIVHSYDGHQFFAPIPQFIVPAPLSPETDIFGYNKPKEGDKKDENEKKEDENDKEEKTEEKKTDEEEEKKD